MRKHNLNKEWGKQCNFGVPEKAQKRVIKSAVTKAATPVVKAAKKLVRLGTGLKPDGSQREHLRNTITKTRAKIYKNGTVLVVAGPKAKAAPSSSSSKSE